MSFFATLGEDGTYSLTMAGYTALVIIMLAILIVGAAIFGKGHRMTARQLAFSAMAIALAMITSFVKFIQLPMGGSVTLFSMLFITLIGYWFGIGAGLTSAVAYGLLQLIVDPYILSVPQMLVDYIFAFGALGLSGFFRNRKYGLWTGYIAAVIGRYFFATLSGVIFFGAYAPSNFPNPLVYSLVYNGSYLGLEALLTLIVMSIPPVTKTLKRVKLLADGEE